MTWEIIIFAVIAVVIVVLVIPLCPEHHRTGGKGVAIHAGQKTWEAIFGTEEELIEKRNQLLGL